MRTKKVLSLILVLLMLVSLLAGCGTTASDKPSDQDVKRAGVAASGNWTDSGNYTTAWYGTGGLTSYTLADASDLAGLAAIVNGTATGITQDSFSAATVTLSSSVDISAFNWIPIGLATISENANTNSPIVTGGYGFAGTFNGGGNAITGLSLTATQSGSGLFGYVTATGVVKNLTLGAITAGVSDSSVTTPATGTFDAIGGAVGYNSGTINNVINNAAVTTTNSSVYNIGGVSGFNNGYYADGSGVAPYGAILNSTNNAAISGYTKVGGITGENSGYITSCANTGTINSASTSKAGIGGIAGRNGNNNTAVEIGLIYNSYNWGSVGTADGSSWNGGIAGFSDSLSVISGCYSTGTINGYKTYAQICGDNENAADTGSTNFGLSGSAAGGATATGDTGTVLLQSAMQASSFLTTLNGIADTTPAIWTQASGAYPTLTGNGTVPPSYPSNPSNPSNNYPQIYLSQTNGSDNNAGYPSGSPVQTLAKAVALANLSTNTGVSIIVLDPITVSDTETAYSSNNTNNLLQVIWSGTAGTTTPMFTISGSLTIGGLNIVTATGPQDAFDVASGGFLIVHNGSIINASGIGVNVLSGGTFSTNWSTINGSPYSVQVADGTSSFTLNPSPSQAVTLNAPVYLGTGAYISIGSALTSGTTVQVVCEEDITAGYVLVATATSEEIAEDSLPNFAYSGGGASFAQDGADIYVSSASR